jgi:hypothetical protein
MPPPAPDLVLELVTPPLDSIILPGVVRQSLLDLAQSWVGRGVHVIACLCVGARAPGGCDGGWNTLARPCPPSLWVCFPPSVFLSIPREGEAGAAVGQPSGNMVSLPLPCRVSSGWWSARSP